MYQGNTDETKVGNVSQIKVKGATAESYKYSHTHTTLKVQMLECNLETTG